MREIKFRMWDIQFKKMRYEIDSIGFDIDDRLPFSVRAIPGYGKTQLVGKTWIDDEGNKILHGNEEGYLMQYTGLKDKKRCEVYEGDIVQTSFSKREGFAYECLYHEASGSYLFDPFMLGDKEAPLLGIEEFAQSWEDVEICEVIGNIYENPELLGGSN